MIRGPYVLFTRIELVKTKSGRLYCGELWAKDLLLHLDYISEFQLCCPIIISDDVEGLVDISSYAISHVFPLKKDGGLFSVARNFFPNFMGVTSACKNASIVHSGGAGWAFPLSFYLFFIKPFYSFKWIMLIESSFWMLSKGEPASLRKRMEHYVHKAILSKAIKSADARIFTQSFYREYFLKADTERTLVSPASWVDEKHILSTDVINHRSESRQGTLNMIYPARLEENKGVQVLFDAIHHLKNMGVSVNITIMGKGALQQACEAFSKEDYGTVKVIYKKPATYGTAFFDVLGTYDIVLVPNIREEQPRIIFDAFSQGVAVIATDTSGILDITIDNVNALICKRGDAQSLADTISHAVNNPNLTTKLGREGLKYARGRTHLQMHKDRHLFLQKVLNH